MAIRVTDAFSPAARGDQCSICGNGNRPFPTDEDHPAGRERVLDLDIHIEYEGDFEICETCALEIGAAVGLERPAVVSAFREAAEEALAREAELEAQLATKTEAVNTLAQLQADAAREHAAALAKAYDDGFTAGAPVPA